MLGFLNRLLGLGRKPEPKEEPRDDSSPSAPAIAVDLHQVISTAPRAARAGFVPAREFQKRDMPARILKIAWFGNCGKPLKLELSMPIRQVASWQEATELCLSNEWSDIQDRASEHLFNWLQEHAVAAFRTWSDVVAQHNKQTIAPILDPQIEPYFAQNKLDHELVHSVRKDVRQALLENTYVPTGHRSYFFLELFELYETGHFPCGWRGAWPVGELLFL